MPETNEQWWERINAHLAESREKAIEESMRLNGWTREFTEVFVTNLEKNMLKELGLE